MVLRCQPIAVEKKKSEDTTIHSEKSRSKKIQKYETDLKLANQTMQMIRMKSTVVLGLSFFILMGILSSM